MKFCKEITHCCRWSATALLIGLVSSVVSAGEITSSSPAIPGYGAVHSLPGAAYQPKKNTNYNIVFEITGKSEKPSEINSGLTRVARTINLYVEGGTPLDHLKLVAVVSGQATEALLDNEHYRMQFGIDNPNIALIKELRAAGVDITVSGQSVAEHHYEPGWILSDVTQALSSLTTITMLEQKGYVLMPL